jgi:hypothetical protein
MIKSLPTTLCLGLSLLFINCSDDSESTDDTPEPEPEQVIDNYSYILLSQNGFLYELGDETGEVSSKGKVNGIIANGSLNTFTESEENYFVYEQMPEIFETDGTSNGFQGQLCVINKINLSSNCTILDFSNEVFPEFSGLIALDWDSANNNFVGIVSQVWIGAIDPVNYVVRIDPNTFEITYTGIQFFQSYIASSCLVGSKYYLSSSTSDFDGRGFSELRVIDLQDGGSAEIDFSNFNEPPFLLSKSSTENTLFGIAQQADLSGVIQRIPVIFNSPESTFETFPVNQSFYERIEYGKSYFNNLSKEHVMLIGTEGVSSLLRFNVNTKSFKIVEINTNELSLGSSIAIIGFR